MHDDTRQPTVIDAAIDDVAHAMTRGEPGARFRRGVAERIRAPRRPMVTVPRLAIVTAVLMLIGLWTVRQSQRVQQVEEVQPVQPVREVKAPDRQPVQQAAVHKGEAPREVRVFPPFRIPRDAHIVMDALHRPTDVPGIEPVVVAPVLIDAIDIGEDVKPPSLTVSEIVVEPLKVEPLGEPRY